MKKFLFLVTLAATLTCQAQNVEKLQKKVAAGDVKAMLELADYYQAGYGVPVDTAKALELYRQADALGSAEAKGHLGRMALYYGPLGHDSVECYRLSMASANAGSPYGVYRLAVCYLDGIGVKRDYDQCHALLEQAMKMGCPEAYSLVGRGYLFGQSGYARDIEKAYPYLKKSSVGCCGSKYNLMAQYYWVKGDVKEAVKWLEKGRKEGNMQAVAGYARYMEYGMGMPADERGALAEYRRLKEKFHDDNDYKMMEANLLASARDTTLRDYSTALLLYEEIGNEPFASNYDAIGLSYINGTMTPVDSTMAYHYWLRGARKNDVYSMVHLSQYYASIDRNDSAEFYLRKACEWESEDAAYILASYYLGVDSVLDSVLGMQYLQKAADWGSDQARVAIGQVYLGNGEYDKAMECYDKAISNAYYDAYLYKAELSLLDGGQKSYLKLLEKGGKMGSSLCYGVLGEFYENNQDYKKALKFYELSASPQADYRIARIYLSGVIDTTEATLQKGHRLMQRSAYAGNRDGMYWLGYDYQQGVGCRQNLDSSFYYFNALAEQNDGMALMQLAIAYEHGRGVEADTALAMDYYLRAGQNGVSDGYAYLGDFYRNGTTTVAPDSAKAFEYYMLATTIPDGNTAGLYYVGDSYLRGIGVAKDTAAALPYFRQAAAQGSYRSMAILGDYFESGWGGLQTNGDSALHYYYLASQGNDPRGDFKIGAFLYDNENYEMALQYFTSAAHNGDIDAYVSYAQAMLAGNGMEANPAQACDMLEQLAPVATDGRPQLLLAIAHLKGYGRQIDNDLVLSYLDSAIVRGNTNAMMLLASMYEDGEVVSRDTVRSVEYYQMAVDHGSIRATLHLASMYLEGNGAPKDAKRAAELYQSAADRGSLEGLCRLGLCYEEGEGVILNSRKAYNLYMQAADRGSSFGMFLVAMCYAEGVYVKEDMEQAAQWFLKGAEAGSVRCCYFIGKMYATGEGVKKNKKEAKKWLTIAAQNGIDAAEQILREL